MFSLSWAVGYCCCFCRCTVHTRALLFCFLGTSIHVAFPPPPTSASAHAVRAPLSFPACIILFLLCLLFTTCSAYIHGIKSRKTVYIQKWDCLYDTSAAHRVVRASADHRAPGGWRGSHTRPRGGEARRDKARMGAWGSGPASAVRGCAWKSQGRCPTKC